MILGGDKFTLSHGGAELVDLSPEGMDCPLPGDFPHKDYLIDAVGGLANGIPVVCGGEGLRLCHGYRFEAQSWEREAFELLEARWESRGLVMDNGTWIVLGGRDKDNVGIATSEVFVGGR